MNLIDLSLRRPVFAWVLMFSLICFGAISLSRMGVSQMPDVNFPILDISVTYEGAAPEVVEADLLVPLEEQLLMIEGIKEMRSSASQGTGRISLEFGIDRNVDVALQEVQSAISQLRLPPGVDPPIIRKQNPEEDPILIVSIYGTKSIREILNWTDTYLSDQIRFIEGVGEVDVAGFSVRNLRVWFDREKMERLELTVTDIVDALSTQHLESAAGQFTQGPRELRVRWLGEATTPEEVGEIVIQRRGGQMIFNRGIRIKDVARVEDGLSDIRRLARFEGQPSIAIRIKKQRGTNEVEISKAVQERLVSIKKDFPEGINYRVNVDFTRSTEATVHLTIEKLWVAALITILICFLFLGSYHAALNILFSIPTSIVGTFIILYFSGFTLNLFTLLALTLSISIVVDDAIMLLENIMRHYRMGKGAIKAASDGAREVMPAAIAATLAVVAIFLPVVFMAGVVGKFFFQFGITMSAAVLLSLLEAATITPMRAAVFLRNEPKMGRYEKWIDELFEKFGHLYQSSLKPILAWKWIVLITSTAVFGASLFLIAKVRQEFVPPQDQDILIVTAQTPPGSSLEFTNQASLKFEEILKSMPEIEGFVVSVGGGSGGGQVNQIFTPVRLVPRDKREINHVEVMNRLRAKFKDLKGMRVSMRDISARNLTAGRLNPLALSIRGADLSVMNEKSQEIIKRLEDEKLGVDLDTDYRVGIPELVVTPNRQKMAERKVSVSDVGMVLSAAVGGLRQGRYTADGRRYDIRFKMPDDKIRSTVDITSLYVRNFVGNLIPLSELVDVKEGTAAQSISRVNRQRAISIFGNIAPGASQGAVLTRAEEIAREVLPDGYTVALEGASAGFDEAFSSLYIALLIGVLVAYLILAVQFNSFVHPISVLIALPFSVTGALLALWMFNLSLNLFSFIGLIVLMGIAKKNSILLVEFTNQVREHGEKDTYTALLKACPVRLRPIIMTSVATVAAALPLVLGGGIGAETRTPMGMSIVGGTIISTILTLYVVPALYLILSRFESKRNREQRLEHAS